MWFAYLRIYCCKMLASCALEHGSDVMLNDRKSLNGDREAVLVLTVSFTLLTFDAAQKAFATCLASQGSDPILSASASKPADAASLIPIRRQTDFFR